jgi:hypothetical protein
VNRDERKRLIHVETCRCVGRIQEGLNETLSVEVWEALIAQIESSIEYALGSGSNS